MRIKEINKGDSFGRWTATGRFNEMPGNVQREIEVACDCGSSPKFVRSHSLRNGISRSCGCLRLEMKTKHNASNTPLFRVWCGMVRRCSDPKNQDFNRYGGRGIAVCVQWADSFSCFRKWAIAEGYSDNLTIERIDNNGNYELGNCRWATRAEQSINKSNSHLIKAFGENKCLMEWVRDPRASVTHATIAYRISRGMPPETAIALPARQFKGCANV